jgi:hypothetical protein
LSVNKGTACRPDQTIMALASHGEVAGSGTAAQNLPGEMLLGAPRGVVLLVVGGQRREVGRELGAKLVGAVARDGQPGAVCRAIEGERGDDQKSARGDGGRSEVDVGRAVGRVGEEGRQPIYTVGWAVIPAMCATTCSLG